MSDFAKAVLDPAALERFNQHQLKHCHYVDMMQTPDNLEFAYSSYEPPVSCNVDLPEDRSDILEWEEASKRLDNLGVWPPAEEKVKRDEALATLKKGREPISATNADRRISELLEQRRLEEHERVERLNDKAIMDKIESEKEQPRNKVKRKKVRPFTESELKQLLNKYTSQDPWSSKRPVSCHEAASAMLIMTAIKKRYGDAKAMHHAIYGPGGYMCTKYWNELVKDVREWEGKHLSDEISGECVK